MKLNCPSLSFSLLCLVLTPSMAWQPNPRELDSAINSGEFAPYLTNATNWLAKKVPADPSGITQPALATLLKQPVVETVLMQRTILAKLGPDKAAAFSRADVPGKNFLTWLLKDANAMREYLIATTPLSIPVREDNSHGLSTEVLNRWKALWASDPDSNAGIYLRLALATAIRPPGTGSRGAGQQAKPSDPMVRYNYFKAAHKKGELFPSFNKLTAWEMQHVVCSGASEADLTWGRQMINTWRPDYRIGEKVVDTTSCIWRRNSPVPLVDYKAIADGGGKCGPRSSWSVFICQAFGIPAIGVGQPAHACVAYKPFDRTWQVAYGKGWDASRLEGMGGREFLASVEARERPEIFAATEQIRWLALAVPAKQPHANALLETAKLIAKSAKGGNHDFSASEKAGEADSDGGAIVTAKASAATRPEPPAKVAPGVIHVQGTSYFNTGGITVWGGEPRVAVLDSWDGGKQLHFNQGMASAWVGYKIDVPATGIYEMSMKVSAINSGQNFSVRSFGAMAKVKNATASAVWHNDVKGLGPLLAVDNDPSTRWAVNFGIDSAWIDLDLGEPTTINTMMMDERAYGKVSKYKVEYKNGAAWQMLFEGTTIGSDFVKDFPPVKATNVRLTTLDCSGNTGGPTFWDISVGSTKDGHAFVPLPCTNGLWQQTKPFDIRLAKGSQTLWIIAGYQRGVSMKSFDLKLKSRQG